MERVLVNQRRARNVPRTITEVSVFEVATRVSVMFHEKGTQMTTKKKTSEEKKKKEKRK